MIRIDDSLIYDPATGIWYTLSVGWNFMNSLDEATAAGETWPAVSISSVHSPAETESLRIEKEAAARFWDRLNHMADESSAHQIAALLENLQYISSAAPDEFLELEDHETIAVVMTVKAIRDIRAALEAAEGKTK